MLNFDIERIKSFKKLKDNWDMSGSPPISEFVIDRAITILENSIVDPSSILPSKNDTIELKYISNTKDLIITVSKNDIEFLLYETTQTEWKAEVDSDVNVAIKIFLD